MSVGTGDFKELLYACRDGDLEMVRYFVVRGADLNFLHAEFLFAPIHASVRGGHYEVTQFLLGQGANPNLSEGYSDETPWLIAQRGGDLAMLALLRAHGGGPKGGGRPTLFLRLKDKLLQLVGF